MLFVSGAYYIYNLKSRSLKSADLYNSFVLLDPGLITGHIYFLTGIHIW